jgi:site-specific recombinase XerD
MFPEIERFQTYQHQKSPYTSTHIHYTSDVKLFFTWIDKQPENVRVQDIDDFIDYCMAEGYAMSTINRRLSALRAFFSFVNYDGDLGTPNPVIPRRHFIRISRRLPKDLLDDEVARLFKAILHPRDRAMFLLMLRCGMRVGEVSNLSMGDLNLEAKTRRPPHLWIRRRGSKDRLIFLGTQPRTAMQNWIQMRPITEETAVFLNRCGGRLSVTGIQNRLSSYCHQVGVGVTCQQLRHTYGRHLADACTALTSIQFLLGHARLSSTEIYQFISNPQVQLDYDAAIEQISERLSLNGGTK